MQLCTSRDGYAWDRAPDRTPVIANGGYGAWDAGMIYRTAGPHTVGDELWIHYNGFRDRHGPPYNWPGGRSSGIGLARLRRDGFMALDACEQGGAVTTRPLRFEADAETLSVNADAGSGDCRVEIRDAENRPVPGFTLADSDPLRGDGTRQVAQWRGNPDLSRIAGQTVRLHFALHAARLYSFRFEPGAADNPQPQDRS